MIATTVAILATCLFNVISGLSECNSHISVALKTDCAEEERDDGFSCWLDTYGRGVGRIPDKAPCPDGLRDDGLSCWSDAHIYGKGCCCTVWGCCNQCPAGYHDDSCTCRKIDVGIKLTLFDRYSCRDDEDLYGALCYPKCKEGYHAVECCLCEPEGGPRITKTHYDRHICPTDTDYFAGFCIRIESCTLDEVVGFLLNPIHWTSEKLQELDELFKSKT